MTLRFALSFVVAVSLPLAACDKPDEAALAKSDLAFKGQMVDGELQAIASRPVMVGTGGPRANACPSVAAPAADTLTVRWSNDATGPAKAEVEGDVAVCQTDGAWSGIVFPATGQDLGECATSTPVRSAREYQGPCRWGWVESDDLKRAAG